MIHNLLNNILANDEIFDTDIRKERFHKNSDEVLERFDSVISKAYGIYEDYSILVFDDEQITCITKGTLESHSVTLNFGVKAFYDELQAESSSLFAKLQNARNAAELLLEMSKEETILFESKINAFASKLVKDIRSFNKNIMFVELSSNESFSKLFGLRTEILQKTNDAKIVHHNVSEINVDVLVYRKWIETPYFQSILEKKETIPFSIEMQISNDEHESYITLLAMDTDVATLTIEIDKLLQKKLASSYASVVFDAKEDNSVVLRLIDRYTRQSIKTLQWNYTTQERQQELVSLEMQINKDFSITLVAKSKQSQKEIAKIKTTIKELASE